MGSMRKRIVTFYYEEASIILNIKIHSNEISFYCGWPYTQIISSKRKVFANDS